MSYYSWERVSFQRMGRGCCRQREATISPSYRVVNLRYPSIERVEKY
jgi:hypothetical protein